MKNCEHIISSLLFLVKTNLPTPYSLLLESPGIISQGLSQLILSVSNFGYVLLKNKWSVTNSISAYIHSFYK